MFKPNSNWTTSQARLWLPLNLCAVALECSITDRLHRNDCLVSGLCAAKLGSLQQLRPTAQRHARDAVEQRLLQSTWREWTLRDDELVFFFVQSFDRLFRELSRALVIVARGSCALVAP